MAEPIIITHPLIQDKLTLLRNKDTISSMFRCVLSELSHLLGYEAMRSWPTMQHEVTTPLNINVSGEIIRSRDVALVSVLRGGEGMLDGMLRLVPRACVGHIGLYRDPKTTSIIEYYCKMPHDMHHKHAIILDPLVATGHSAAVTISRVKEYNPQTITFICVVAAQQGLDYINTNHPEITVYTAAVDPQLDRNNFITPGVGDAGDRMYGNA